MFLSSLKSYFLHNYGLRRNIFSTLSTLIIVDWMSPFSSTTTTTINLELSASVNPQLWLQELIKYHALILRLSYNPVKRYESKAEQHTKDRTYGASSSPDSPPRRDSTELVGFRWAIRAYIRNSELTTVVPGRQQSAGSVRLSRWF